MTIDKRVKRLRDKQSRRDQEEMNKGLNASLATYEGRRFLWSLLAEGYMFHNAFNGNALQTSFNCGKQENAQLLLARIMEVNPDAYLQMSKENQAWEEQCLQEQAKLNEEYEEEN